MAKEAGVTKEVQVKEVKVKEVFVGQEEEDQDCYRGTHEWQHELPLKLSAGLK